MTIAPAELFVLLAAPFIGSFLGVLARRLPAGRDVIFARSACPACGKPLSPLELVPLLSWLWQRGRCRNCGAALGLFYPAIELLASVVAVTAALLNEGWLFYASAALGFVLLALAFSDLESFTLPDVLNLPLIPTGLALAYFLPGADWSDHLIGAVAGGGALYAVGEAYRLLRGRSGLGLGDVKLFAAAGAWLGWEALPGVLLLSALMALAAVLALLLSGRRVTATTKIPFGTPLAAAFYIAWLSGVASIA